MQITKTAKSDLDGGQSQAKLLDTIRDIKYEMQANAALPAAAEGKDGESGGEAASHQQSFPFVQKHEMGN